MRVALQERGEINTIRSPINQAGVFVELCGDDTRLTASGRNYSDAGVRVEVKLIAVASHKSDLATIRRPARPRIWPLRIEQFLHQLVCQVEGIDLRRIRRT